MATTDYLNLRESVVSVLQSRGIPQQVKNNDVRIINDFRKSLGLQGNFSGDKKKSAYQHFRKGAISAMNEAGIPVEKNVPDGELIRHIHGLAVKRS